MKKIVKVLFAFVVLIVASGTCVYATTVGDQLKTPDEGWKRYDDRNSLIYYSGTVKQVQSDNYYEGTHTYFNETYNDGRVHFSFTGSEVRIIASRYTERSKNIKIVIDGVEENYSDYGNLLYSCLVFEKTGLAEGIHNVMIYQPNNEVFGLDAIDIDSEGELVEIEKPAKPLDLVATASTDSIMLNWSAVDGATSYKILRSTTSSSVEIAIETDVIGTSYIDNDVDKETTYYYVVIAVIDGVESPKSNQASANISELNNVLKLVIEVSEDKQLSVSDDLLDNQDMIWESSNDSIVTVDSNGKITGLKPGDVVITCTDPQGSYIEKVNVLVVELELQLAIDLEIGDGCRLAIGSLENSTTISWVSNNLDVATVSSKGKVKAVSEGLTYISAFDENGNELGRIYIRVN